MTYYEELGVSQRATQEEIRRAFRNACRLLHPDLQQDPVLRQVAEMQMRRLNEVVETLCDDSRRAAYDATARAGLSGAQFGLTRLESVQPEAPTVALPPPPAAAILAGLFMGCLLMYCLVALTTAPLEIAATGQKPLETTSRQSTTKALSAKTAVPPAGARRVGPAPSSPLLSPLSPPPSSPPSSPPSPTLASVTAPALEQQAQASVVPTPPMPVVQANNPQSLIPRPEAAPLAEESNAASHAIRANGSAFETAGLGGIWLYVPEQGDRPEKGEYQAEFIEMKIQQAGSQIQGSFRSRYRIPDRPLNPAVNFRFRGPANSTQFQWEGPGGSIGILKLTLKSPISLDANWEAQSVGSQLGLASGTATLIRRLE